MRNFHEIVLTGGPCSGKTSAKAWLTEYFTARGFRVIMVPEIASMVIGSGLSGALQEKRESFLAIEEGLFDLQLEARKCYKRIAESIAPDKVLLIYDRAEGDIRSYIGEDGWNSFIEERNLSESEVLHTYDLVVHLVSAAVGAKEYYTTENNPARYETADEAAIRDKRTIRAWLGCPRFRIIDNSTGFEEKMERMLNAISESVDVTDIRR